MRMCMSLTQTLDYIEIEIDLTNILPGVYYIFLLSASRCWRLGLFMFVSSERWQGLRLLWQQFQYAELTHTYTLKPTASERGRESLTHANACQ